jgi:hypothetical protein
LRAHVALVGDTMPNKNCEIHLDNTRTKENIWKEYKTTRIDEGCEKPINYRQFLSMWNDCMPYVKIREHKVRGHALMN